MSQTAVLVWLSASSLLPTFRADLDAFAESRILRLEAPRANTRAAVATDYAPDAVERVESSVEEARTESAALEPSRALSAIERAEHVLREHPELPQSAWLMAELLELSAEIEGATPEGAEAASQLRKRRAALEGPRATPFSDRAPVAETDAPALRPISVEGLEPGDTLDWDGMQRSSALDTAAGEHHVRVTRSGRLLWAGWVTLRSSDDFVHLPVPESAPCSSDDLASARFALGRAAAPPHARCESYVLARPHPGGGIEAALCERALCGNVLIWGERTSPRAPSSTQKKLWPYLAAAGAAGLAIAGLVLWRSGAFDRDSPGSNEAWVFTGQKPMGLHF